MVASGGGAGFVPVAPGTAGSVAGLALGTLLLAGGHFVLLVGVLSVSALGVWAVTATGAGGTDPGWVVIDEVAGQMIALLALPRPTLPGICLAFLLFRLFDIVKLGPVGWADSRHDPWGIMADDWIAGLFAAVAILCAALLFRARWL